MVLTFKDLSKGHACAFLYSAGVNNSSSAPQRNGVAVCSQKRALLVALVVLGTLFATSLIIAFGGSQNGV